MRLVDDKMCCVKFEDKQRNCSCCRRSTNTPCCRDVTGTCRTCCRDSLIVVLLLLGVAAGVVLGVCLRVFVPAYQQPKLHPREMMYLFFPAEVFLRFMTFVVAPFLVCSIVSGIGKLSDPLERVRAAWMPLADCKHIVYI